MKHKLAWAMIVKGDDKEAEFLANCLKYVAPYVDSIFITITNNPGEKTNSKVQGVAELYNANISYFEWCNDFSKARNFNFSQVPKEYEYIGWCDADDGIRGIENLKDIIDKNPADAYSMFYLYAFDEYKNPVVVHPKTRIIKNDGCVEWAGYLHEDFKENRAITNYFIKNIEVLHLSNDERFEENKKRNLEVAEYNLKLEPEDPRSYWNVGNSLKALGKNKEAIDIFSQFMKLSNSEDEKYIVRLRMSESYWAMDDKEKAIDEARYAIGLKPEYPDAYNLLGSLFLNSGKYEKARDMYLMGLTRKPPYYKIMVYNPRDYDYVPLLNLAKAYFGLSLPTLALECLKGCAKIQPQDKKLKKTIKNMEKEAEKFNKVITIIKKLSKTKDKEKLKKELDKIPDDFKSHPGICNLRNINFIKETSSGKDLVIFCGYTEREWTPEALKEGIGGSEEAIIHLARGLNDKGWNVTVYNNCGYKELEFNGVKYKPFWAWNTRDKQDITILWRTPRYLDYEINSDKIFVDLHDVIQEGEFNEKRLTKINKIFVKSKFHRSLFPNIPDDKFEIIPNGIKVDDFKEIKKDPYLMINTSSPDRGLNGLIDLFKEVKKEIPEAKLKWAYGWGVFDVVHGDNPKVMDWKNNVIKKMEEAGVENLGRISHEEVANLYSEASIFAYPTEFAEIDCISISKAMIAGAYPITTDFSALGERKGHGGEYIHSKKTKDNWCKPNQFDFSIEDEETKKEWVKATIERLKTPPAKEELDNMKNWVIDNFNWEKIISKWDNVIK